MVSSLSPSHNVLLVSNGRRTSAHMIKRRRSPPASADMALRDAGRGGLRSKAGWLMGRRPNAAFALAHAATTPWYHAMKEAESERRST